jgi:hypothetical protein
VSVYGLDAAFPGRIQPALLRVYRQISRMWHYWFGFLPPESEKEELMGRSRINNGEKRGRSENGEDEQEGEDEAGSPAYARKKRKLMDSETQTTPKKQLSLLDINTEDSPMTKVLIEKAWKVEMELRKTKEAIELRRRSRNLLNELRISD